jgi:hypothetical protein
MQYEFIHSSVTWSEINCVKTREFVYFSNWEENCQRCNTIGNIMRFHFNAKKYFKLKNKSKIEPNNEPTILTGHGRI